MERMTETDIKTLRALQAKAKRVARFDADCRAWADEHKEELLTKWGISCTDMTYSSVSDTKDSKSEDASIEDALASYL